MSSDINFEKFLSTELTIKGFSGGYCSYFEVISHKNYGGVQKRLVDSIFLDLTFPQAPVGNKETEPKWFFLFLRLNS